jgi:hypothetical protein
VTALMSIGCICSTNGGVEKCKQNLFDETNAETMKRGNRFYLKQDQ